MSSLPAEPAAASAASTPSSGAAAPDAPAAHAPPTLGTLGTHPLPHVARPIAPEALTPVARVVVTCLYRHACERDATRLRRGDAARPSLAGDALVEALLLECELEAGARGLVLAAGALERELRRVGASVTLPAVGADAAACAQATCTLRALRLSRLAKGVEVRGDGFMLPLVALVPPARAPAPPKAGKALSSLSNAALMERLMGAPPERRVCPAGAPALPHAPALGLLLVDGRMRPSCDAAFHAGSASQANGTWRAAHAAPAPEAQLYLAQLQSIKRPRPQWC